MNTTYWMLLGLLVVVPGILSMFFKGFSFDPRRWRRQVPVPVQMRREDDRFRIS